LKERLQVRNKRLILASLLLAAFVINVDTTIVNVALPTLVRGCMRRPASCSGSSTPTTWCSPRWCRRRAASRTGPAGRRGAGVPVAHPDSAQTAAAGYLTPLYQRRP